MSLPNLTLAAARYVLGTLPSWDIPRIADDLLNRGIYADSLARLYDVKKPIMADVGPIFESALKELEIGIPPGTMPTRFSCDMLFDRSLRASSRRWMG
jgi:hypothetical protein